MRYSVRHLLQQMQKRSQSIQGFMELCEAYEAHKFQNLQEVEYIYLLEKKYYLCKMFCKELAAKLESNKFAKPSFGATNSGERYQDGGLATSPVSSRYQNLNLHTAIHYDLNNTFFHQLLKSLIGTD